MAASHQVPVAKAVDANLRLTFARRVLQWSEAGAAPVPLNLLGLPHALFSICARGFGQERHPAQLLNGGMDTPDEQWKRWTGCEWKEYQTDHSVEWLSAAVAAFVAVHRSGGLNFPDSAANPHLQGRRPDAAHPLGGEVETLPVGAQGPDPDRALYPRRRLEERKRVLDEEGLGCQPNPLLPKESAAGGTPTLEAVGVSVSDLNVELPLSPNPGLRSCGGFERSPSAQSRDRSPSARSVSDRSPSLKDQPWPDFGPINKAAAMVVILDAQVNQTRKEVGSLDSKVDILGTQMQGMQATLDDVKVVLMQLFPKPKQDAPVRPVPVRPVPVRPSASPLTVSGTPSPLGNLGTTLAARPGSPQTSVASLVTPSVAAATLQRLSQRRTSSPRPSGDALHRTRQIRYGMRAPSSPSLSSPRSEAATYVSNGNY